MLCRLAVKEQYCDQLLTKTKAQGSKIAIQAVTIGVQRCLLVRSYNRSDAAEARAREAEAKAKQEEERSGLWLTVAFWAEPLHFCRSLFAST